MIADFIVLAAVVATGFLIALWLACKNLAKLAAEADRARDKLACASAENAAERALAYNNLATIYNNAANTFPAVLVSRQLRANPYELHDVELVEEAVRHLKTAESGVAAQGRVMNAYMLWAAGMGDVPLEDCEKPESRPESR